MDIIIESRGIQREVPDICGIDGWDFPSGCLEKEKEGMNMKWLRIRNEISEKDMDALEEKLEIHLPKDYKMAMPRLHCGAPEKQAVFVEGMGECSYSRNLPLTEKRKGNVFVLYEIMKQRGHHLFPFASVGNGDYFCFDLDHENRVVYWFHENDTVYPVCRTFRELTEMLH